jgi:hypothetical protein
MKEKKKLFPRETKPAYPLKSHNQMAGYNLPVHNK